MAMRLDGGQGGAGKKRGATLPKKPPQLGTPGRNSTGVPMPRNPAPQLGTPGKNSSGVPMPRPKYSTKSINTGGGGGVGVGATGTVAAQGGGGGGGGAEMFAAEATAPPPPSQDEWLAQDSQFIDEKSAAEQDYQNLLAKLAQQKTDYELDNKNTLRNLGWQSDNNSWNMNDRLTGYGNAYQNQLNDFASRGLMDSSLYGEAQNDLNRGFNQQRDDLATALQNFNAGQATDRASAQTSRDQAQAAAQRQALLRYAAQYSL